MSLQSGDKLGPYEILAPIGKGAMGEVYKARDTRLNRDVAIKRFIGTNSARFQQEARAIAALNHPNICQIFDVGPDYLVLEYIEGKPLQGPVSEEQARRLALEILNALEEAHTTGILHRDLKPANILVTSRGSAKLLDFGLAKLLEQEDATLTGEGVMIGTPAYMSPEQVRGESADIRSDVFSIGVVLYELIAGIRAFPGNSQLAVIRSILEHDPLPLQSELWRVIGRCLKKDPAARFQSASDIAKALTGNTGGVLPEAKPAPSIAVLPFANMSADADNEYFSDGLTEEIINLLAKIPGLKVTARTSAFAFRGKEQDITKIAEALRVKTVLEGSVRKMGNRIRVTVQLINATDGYHLWSDRYDRDLTDIFAVQDEIASAIAGALKLKLGPALGRTYQPNLPAYELFLRGRYHMMRYTSDDFRIGKALLEKAIELDPNFATPHSGLANYYNNTAIEELEPPHEAIPLARASCRKALQLDPNDADAHNALGFIAATYDYNWEEARERYARAITLAPTAQATSVLGNHQVSNAVFYVGPALNRVSDANSALEDAVKNDPLNVGLRAIWTHHLRFDGDYTRADAELKEALAIDPGFWLTNYSKAELEALRGAWMNALPAAELTHALVPWHARATGLLAGVLSMVGQAERAATLVETTKTQASFGMVLYHLVRSEGELAADWYAKAIEAREPFAVIYAPSNILRPIHDAGRWPALAAKMNLPTARAT
jgi:serine/threonine protein kinase